MFWLSSHLCSKLYDKYCHWNHFHRWVFQRFSTGASRMKCTRWWIQGRGAKHDAPRSNFLYFHAVFGKKNCKIIGTRTHLWGLRSLLGNPESATGNRQLYCIDLLPLCFSTHVCFDKNSAIVIKQTFKWFCRVLEITLIGYLEHFQTLV